MQRRGSRKSERLALIAGVVLSAVLGVFFYIRTDVATAMATCAGLVGIVITLQVESALRERRLADELTRQQRLISRVESIGWLPDLLDEALDALDEIERRRAGTVAAELARKAFTAFLAQARDLRRGRYSDTLESAAPALAHELLERAQHAIVFLRRPWGDAGELPARGGPRRPSRRDAGWPGPGNQTSCSSTAKRHGG